MKHRTYMSLTNSNTYELKINVLVKTFKERDERTEELIDNGKEETEFIYEVIAVDEDGDVISFGSGTTLKEAINAFEYGW